VERLLRDAEVRYSVGEVPADPSREHYAAARRWIACAREAKTWGERAPEAARPGWVVRMKDALVRAVEHRAQARRWRAGRRVTVNYCPSCQEPILDGDTCPECAPEDADSRALLLRAAARVERRRAVHAYYAAARQTLKLVRLYRDEPGTSGRREREALDEVKKLRAAITALRDLDRRQNETSMPGIRKAPLSSPPSERKRAI
jgi:hypothetical protein